MTFKCAWNFPTMAMGKYIEQQRWEFVVDSVFNLGVHEFLINYSQQDLMNRYTLLINLETTSAW